MNPDNTNPPLDAEKPAEAESDPAPAKAKAGRPPGRRSQVSEKNLAQAEEILQLKVQGKSDTDIKRILKLRERDFEKRLKLIRENRLLNRQAQHACQEIVLRLFSLRNHVHGKMEGLGAKEHHHRIKHGQLVLDTEKEMLNVAKQLGFWPPPIDKPLDDENHDAKKGEKREDQSGLPSLDGLSDEELENAVGNLIQKA